MSGSALIIGGSRGLGKSLVSRYAKLYGPSNVYTTIRSEVKSGEFEDGVNVISGVDLGVEGCGEKVADGMKGRKVGVVVYVAGVLLTEKNLEADWKDQITMYTICSIAPVFIIHSLLTSNLLIPSQSKVILLTSEGGSIALRTEGEGGGMYGHHGSKAAGNMVGKLLGYDLKEKGIPIAMVHPGFLKTEMTKNAGMEEYYEKMGAVTPDEAAVPFTDFVDGLTLADTGRFWGTMGGRGIGNAEEVMGKEAAKQLEPLLLPW